MSGTEVPPWLRPDISWGPEGPSIAAHSALHSWAVAAALCAELDGVDRGSAQMTLAFEVQTPESAWMAFDLLAIPRTPCTHRGDDLPSDDACLMAADPQSQLWRICWQHRGVRFPVLTAVPMARGAQPVPVTGFPDSGWPLTFRPELTDLDPADSVLAEVAGGEDCAAWRAWDCPTWCDLPAGHGWRADNGAVFRTHRGTRKFALGARQLSLVVSATEYGGEAGIRWDTPAIHIADVDVPDPSEASFIHALLPQLGAALRTAASPLPPRIRIVGDRRIVDIPAATATAPVQQAAVAQPGAVVARRRTGEVRAC